MDIYLFDLLFMEYLHEDYKNFINDLLSNKEIMVNNLFLKDKSNNDYKSNKLNSDKDNNIFVDHQKSQSCFSNH